MKNLIIVIGVILFLLCNTLYAQNNPETEILGNWVSNLDTSVKLNFTSRGICREYYNNELVSSSRFEFVNSCEGNPSIPSSTLYLRLTDINDSESTCYELNAVDYNDNDILSITSLIDGKIYLYTEQ
jgi:hypothetical protein